MQSKITMERTGKLDSHGKKQSTNINAKITHSHYLIEFKAAII